jgi:hypothetical protein
MACKSNGVLARDLGGDVTQRSRRFSFSSSSFRYQGNQMEGALETFTALHV